MEYIFNSSFSGVGNLVSEFTEQQIEAEPMLFSASVNFVRSHGGVISNAVMDVIRDSADYQWMLQQHARLGYHPVIDTKSVLLMPGQYPCIPGWHCDGVIRSDKYAQPDPHTLGEPIWHYTCVLGNDATHFYGGSVKVDIDEKAVWQSVNNYLEAYGGVVHEGSSGTVYAFKRDQLHRGPAATVRGWRYFFRLSFYHMPTLNKIRNQVQVYVDISKGW